MPLSANTLIHFTDSKDALKQILSENFRIFYCKEMAILGGDQFPFYTPMVSFCDIPLSEVKVHISRYGDYGIGLTKEWGERQGLNPVLYVSRNSMLSSSYLTALRHYSANLGISEWSNELKALIDVIRYIKSYEADLTRKETTTPNYRFSDEREWRYVPHYKEACHMLLFEEYYLNPKNRADSDAMLSPLRLEFVPNDIKYIIIRDDSEITEFVDHLRQAKGKNYTFHDVERLMTRILTVEQIRDDM